MKTKLILIISVTVAAILYNCRSDKYIPDVCFNKNILPIFITNCTYGGCHNSKGGGDDESYNLTTYEGIMQGITPRHPSQSPIYNSIRGNSPSMPPSPHSKLTGKQIDYIKAWINFGAVNSSNCSATCDTANVTFSSSVVPILNTWCVGCHNSGNIGGGYDLTSYNGVVTSITNNRLMGTINQLSGFSGMPKNSSKLSDCDIQVIQKWVNAGHPNN